MNETTHKFEISTGMILGMAVLIAIVFGGGAYAYANNQAEKEKSDLSAQIIELQSQVSSAKTADWQVYKNDRFSYRCPKEWYLGTNKNYNGQVDQSQCGKTYSGEISFDDGVFLTFGFVPQNVSENDISNGKKYADVLIGQVKNEANAEAYVNNNFSGWVSMKNGKHTLRIVARYKVADGYYEINATAAGNSKTDSEFKKMIDDTVGTFQIEK